MADENKIKSEELSEEQMNGVSGGFIVPASSLVRPCASPGCRGKVPVNSGELYCEKCLKNRKGN